VSYPRPEFVPTNAADDRVRWYLRLAGGEREDWRFKRGALLADR